MAAVLHRFGEITAELTNDSAARWSRAPATATSPRSTARRRPSAAPRPCALTPRRWASRSAPHPHRRVRTARHRHRRIAYTSRRGSSAGRRRRNPRLPHVRDLVVGRAPASRPRQRRVAWRARQLATPGGRSPRRAGGIGRGRTASTPTPGPRTAMRRRTAPWRDGQADTVDPARVARLAPPPTQVNSSDVLVCG